MMPENLPEHWLFCTKYQPNYFRRKY